MRKVLISKVVVHHSAGSPFSSRADMLSEALKGGWIDIPYHRLIFSGGLVLQGRSDSMLDGASAGFNDCSFSICLVGNFESTFLNENNKQFKALIQVCAIICRIYGLSERDIIGHYICGEMAEKKYITACPGKHLIALLPVLRKAVKIYLTA